MLVLLACVLSATVADDPLYHAFRPPRQTPVQAAMIENITAFARTHSEEAKPWVLEYMGSEAMRSKLHESLQHLTDDELLERFTWEFERLPIFRNALLFGLDLEDAGVHDDSAISA